MGTQIQVESLDDSAHFARDLAASSTGQAAVSERRTTADILAHVYEKLEAAIPPPPGGSPPVTLLQAWTSVFTGDGRNLFDILEAVGLVSRLQQRLKDQISRSAKLRDTQKRSALGTASSFDGLFRIDQFHMPALGLRLVCDETHRGNLGLIGHSIADEFCEPAVTAADADDLTAALTEVKQLLSDSVLPLELRKSLLRHVDAMLWWLAHPEMASAQDLFETIGSAMVIAKQMQEREPASGPTRPVTRC